MLVTAVTETLEDAADGNAGAGSVVSGTLRRDEGGSARLIASLAEVYVRGVAVDWAAVLGGGQVVDLPTYAFQRRRYWPDVAVISAAMAQAISAVGGNGPSSAAETRFWAAVDGGDLQAVAETLDVTGQPWLGEVVSALASWRRKERKRTEAERWRYRISWAPITQPGAAALDGNWVVLTPDGADCTDLAHACAAAMVAHGAQVMVIEAGAMIADRAVIADLAGAIEQSLLAGAAADGPAARGRRVLSLLALQEALAEFPAVTEGLAGDAGAAGAWRHQVQGTAVGGHPRRGSRGRAGSGDQPGPDPGLGHGPGRGHRVPELVGRPGRPAVGAGRAGRETSGHGARRVRRGPGRDQGGRDPGTAARAA